MPSPVRLDTLDRLKNAILKRVMGVRHNKRRLLYLDDVLDEIARMKALEEPREPEPEALARIAMELSESPDPLARAAERVYNAEFGYHQVLGESQIASGLLEEIERLAKTGGTRR